MENFLTIVISVAVLLVIAGIFLFVYMKTIFGGGLAIWRDLLERLNVRLDKIPNLIETLKLAGVSDLQGADNLQGAGASSAGALGAQEQEDFFGGLIALRQKTWLLDKPDKERVNAELKIASYLERCFEMIGKVEGLERNINFLALRTEFKEITAEIEELTNKYNEKVRHYNGVRGMFFLSSILSLMGFKKMQVLEFE